MYHSLKELLHHIYKNIYIFLIGNQKTCIKEGKK